MSFDRDIFIGHAKEKIKSLKSGDKFTVSEIFVGFQEYDILLKKDKMLLGRIFKNDVEANNINNVTLTGNKKDNRIEYEKI